MIRTVRFAALILGLAWASVMMAAGQAPAGPTMTIDFLALDDKGEPVGPLTPADVSVKVAGKDLVVHAVEMISVETSRTAATGMKPAAGAVPAAFATTRPPAAAAGRHILLLIDEGTLFGMEKIVKDSVAQLIASLGPADRLGLVTTRPGGTIINLTTNHAAVREAVDSMVLGRGNTALCVGALLGQTRSLAESLPRGRATTLALISRGAGAGAVTTGPQLSGAGNCAFRREELQQVAEAVASTQVNYRVFHVGGTGVSPNLDNFAGATGADTGTLSWTDASGIERAVRRSSRFYRATVDAPAAGRDTNQRAELRVSKPGVRVEAPRYLSVQRTAPSFVEAAELLRGEESRSDLEIRVAAFASRNSGGRPVKLVVVIEPANPKVALTSAIVSVVGADGEVAGQWTARRADLSRLPLVTAVPVNPGTYRIRAAAADEEGHGGLAEYDVEAALRGEGVVKMSAVALGAADGARFSPRLLFRDQSAATAYLEVYDAPSSAAVTAVLEVAASPDGQAIASVPGSVSVASAGVHIVTAALPLDSVPAGDNIVRARITVDGSPVGTVLTTLKKAGR